MSRKRVAKNPAFRSPETSGGIATELHPDQLDELWRIITGSIEISPRPPTKQRQRRATLDAHCDSILGGLQDAYRAYAVEQWQVDVHSNLGGEIRDVEALRSALERLAYAASDVMTRSLRIPITAKEPTCTMPAPPYSQRSIVLAMRLPK